MQSQRVDGAAYYFDKQTLGITNNSYEKAAGAELRAKVATVAALESKLWRLTNDLLPDIWKGLEQLTSWHFIIHHSVQKSHLQWWTASVCTTVSYIIAACKYQMHYNLPNIGTLPIYQYIHWCSVWRPKNALTRFEIQLPFSGWPDWLMEQKATKNFTFNNPDKKARKTRKYRSDYCNI